MTAEEILKKHIGSNLYRVVQCEKQILAAMEEYASKPLPGEAVAWIAASERLPEKKVTDIVWEKGASDEVLIYMSGVMTAVYWPDLDHWNIPGHTGDWRPTHWMPLPTTPKTKGGNQ